MKTCFVHNIGGNVLAGSLLAGFAVFFPGCDFFEMPSQRKAKEASVQQAVQQREKEQSEAALQQKIKGECAYLEHFIATQLKMLEAKDKRNAQKIDAVVSDRQKFSMRVNELSEKNLADRRGTHASGLLLLLKDAEINQLAAKYLKGDFALICSEFSEKVRNALEREKERKAALDRNRAEHDQVIKADRQQRESRRKAAQEQEARRRAEIRDLENRIKRIRADMPTLAKDTKRERTRELNVLQRRLDQLQGLNREDRQLIVAKEIESGAEVMRQRVDRETQIANTKTEKAFAGDVTASQLAEEYEKLTVKRLDEAMKQHESAARGAQETISGQVCFLKGASVGLDRLDMAGLKNVRAEVDRKLAEAADTEETKTDGAKRK